MPEITPNLERVKERLYDLRWLATTGALPEDQVCVRGQDRRTLAWLIGTDLPDLIAELERLRGRVEPEPASADKAETDKAKAVASDA